MEDYSDCVYVQTADPEDDYKLSEKTVMESNFVQDSGFTAVNFNALFEGKVDETWVSHAATGLNSHIKRSWTTDDISIMTSLEEVAIMPIPHYNVMSFVGMGSKNQYLAWKKSTNGFFTALHKLGKLKTWSCVTGKLLWQEYQHGDFSESSLRDYRIYRSDKDDMTYMGDYFDYNNAVNPEKSHSLQLLVSEDPVDKSETKRELDTDRLSRPNRNETNKLEEELNRQRNLASGGLDEYPLAEFDKEFIEGNTELFHEHFFEDTNMSHAKDRNDIKYR